LGATAAAVKARTAPVLVKRKVKSSILPSNETPDKTSSIWRFLREYDGEGSLVFGPGAHPITGTPTSTPALTWDNYYKQKIIGSLDEMLLNADKYYVWNSSGTPEQLWGSPPALKPQESLNGKVPVVCADILILSYLDAGIDLSTSIIEFAKTDGGYTFPDYAPRNSVAIKNYLASQGVLNNFGQSNVPIGAGDMVFSVNAGHAGVVHTVIDPNDPSKIFVVQTSSSNATINKITLQEFHDGTVPTASISEVTYGHPQVP
jgi:hypothetical protein